MPVWSPSLELRRGFFAPFSPSVLVHVSRYDAQRAPKRLGVVPIQEQHLAAYSSTFWLLEHACKELIGQDNS
jgi:hypothetical protein